jgi:outer membrane receptor for monomeric catechols
VNENFAARLNLMYEGSDTFRDFGTLERWGVNPTVTFLVDPSTKVRLSYEYYHDDRTADRGNPSLATSAVAPSSTRFNPAGSIRTGRRPYGVLRKPGPERCPRECAADHGVYRS